MAINTLFIGQNAIELPVVDSTNNYAVELLKNETVADGTLILAHEQTSGRGQRGNQWLSKPGQNLTISLVVHPNLPAGKQFYLTKAISLGLAEMLSSLVNERADIKIKWPNDIYAGDKKIAGILIENILRGAQISHSIIGIGLNVNQVEFGDLKATSLQLLTGEKSDLQQCILQLCESIEPRYLQLKAGNYHLLDRDYHNSLYRLDKPCDYENDGISFKASLTGVSEEGKLLLKHQSGEVMGYDFKEVVFL